MQPRWHLWWRLGAVGADLATVTGAAILAVLLRFGPLQVLSSFEPSLQLGFVTAPVPLAVLVWLATFAAIRLYNPRRCRSPLEQGRRLVLGGLAASAAVIVIGFTLKQSPSRAWVGLMTMLAIPLSAGGRAAVWYVLRRVRAGGRATTPALVVGQAEAKHVAETILSKPTTGFRLAGTAGFVIDGIPSFEPWEVGAAVAATDAGAVVVVAEDLVRHEVREAVSVAGELPVEIIVLSALEYAMTRNLMLADVDGQPALSFEGPSLRIHQRAAKRVFDIVLAAAGLVALAPLLLMVGVAIRLDSKGPVLFTQRRVGLRGRPFTLLKFRSMCEGAEALSEGLRSSSSGSNGLLFKLETDPRVTRVGRLLRRFSLDELPQLWNVLRGEMSFVGPRPGLPAEVSAYDDLLVRRLHVRPGISGLWQVSGRSDLSFDEYVRLDLTYVMNWSLLLDLYVLLRTIPAVLQGRGAY